MSADGYVTDLEYVMPEGEVIVTRTDPGSRITYANQAFLDSSGYSLEECMGQPQNIVRHPDMPKEAFADLWRTIRARKPWTGLVKNRRKNGGFYWVRANVTPIIEGGDIVGYMSVRVKPSREEIQGAEALYRGIRSGQLRGVEIREGEVIRRGTMAALARLAQPGATGAVRAGGAVLAALFLALAALSFGGGRGGNDSLLPALALGGCVATLLYTAFLARRLAAPLRAAVDTASQIIAGDVRRQFPEEGVRELRALFRVLNQSNSKLVGVLADTQLAIHSVVTSAHEIARGNSDLSERTCAQAASLEETATSMEEMTSVVKSTADNAQRGNQLATESSTVANRGLQAVQEMVETMNRIAKESDAIASIVGTIDGIAFQTNILALNAAVEAARAGEAGRSFAVVANEVGALAKRSATAAKEIKGLIGESMARIKSGRELVSTAGSTIQGAVASVQQLVVTMSEITAANREQSSGLEQINTAVMHMDTITQQNAALVEEVAATAVTLDAMTGRALQAVSAFKLGVGGGAHAAAVAEPVAYATRPATRAPAPGSHALARARDRAA
ncbi:MAG: methyl-accepting chemotaxis protein [Steroidobacteraceae bacterium]